MARDILSQDELDALLDGVESGDVATDGMAEKAAAKSAGPAKLCDLANRDNAIHNRLSTLNIVKGTSNNCLRPLAFRLVRNQGAPLPAGWLPVKKAQRRVRASLALREPPGDNTCQAVQRSQSIIRSALNTKYIRLLGMSVFGLLQRKAEISAAGAEIVHFSEYLQRMETPTSVNIVRLNPLKGIGMVVYDARLVFGLVDLFFGGAGRHTDIDGREFTIIENRIIDKVLTRTLSGIQGSWQGIIDLQVERVGSEMNPMMAAVHSPDEALVVNTFKLELDGVSGEIDIALPYSMLEPVLDSLDNSNQTEKPGTNHNWAEQLLQHITGVDVELSCAMADAQLTIGDIKNLKVGDVIPITMNDPATLYANGTAIYRTRIGSSNGKVALRVLGAIGS